MRSRRRGELLFSCHSARLGDSVCNALLEHGVFNAFYNWPLTYRRQTRARTRLRKTLPNRFWHVPLIAAACVGAFVLIDLASRYLFAQRPDFHRLHLLWVSMAMPCGMAVTRWAGGHSFLRRILYGVLCGAIIGVGYLCTLRFGPEFLAGTLQADVYMPEGSVEAGIFALLAVHGVIIAELKVKEPKTPPA